GGQAEAARQETEALDALQKGMDSAMQQIARSLKQVILSFGFMPQQDNYGTGYDPLGREHGGNRPPDDVRLPDEKERRRVQEIIRELRGRSNEWERPKVERE